MFYTTTLSKLFESLHKNVQHFNKKAHPLSPWRRWVQWRFQHPNETRSIPLWLVILDSWLVGLLTPLLDFEDLRSSVQPFAAGSALPLWPAWQNSLKKLSKVVLRLLVGPLFLFFFFLTKLGFLLSELWAIWENPKLQCSHIIIVNSNFSYWALSWVQLNL